MSSQPFKIKRSVTTDFVRKTGKSLEEWIKLIEKSAPQDRDERIGWLQTKYKLSSADAKNIVKVMYEGLYNYRGNASLDEHFSKDKAYQRPIYDLLMMHIRRWGPHCVTVNKTYLSLIHNCQFAVAKTSKNGLMIGVVPKALKKIKNKDFVPAKNMAGANITHKIILNDEREVTNSILKVIHTSYDLC